MNAPYENHPSKNLPEEYQWYDSVCRHFSQSENIPVAFFEYDKMVSTHPAFTLGVSLHHELLTSFESIPNSSPSQRQKGIFY